MNKKFIGTFVILIFIGIISVSITEDYNPLGKHTDFPSDSVFEGTIDNYSNVENYEYTISTSTKFGQKNTHLKDINYSFCDSIEILNASQCPQGIAITEDFVMTTSYSTKDGYLGQFMVFDRISGEYLITLGMDKDSHLGGIAYDGENVWVCNSVDKTLERISYDFIYQMAMRNKGEVIDATELVDCYSLKNIPSCITYYNGRLWIATHNILFQSHMVVYYYNENEDALKALSTYNIPAKVQGVAFSEQGEVYLSTSYGRKQSSYLKKYESVFIMTDHVKEPMLNIEMPPCSEEITIYDNTLYVLFESAGDKYIHGTDGKGQSLSPIDKILMIQIENAGD